MPVESFHWMPKTLNMLRVALAIGAISEAVDSLEDAAAEASVVVLAAPVPRRVATCSDPARTSTACVARSMGDNYAGRSFQPTARRRLSSS